MAGPHTIPAATKATATVVSRPILPEDVDVDGPAGSVVRVQGVNHTKEGEFMLRLGYRCSNPHYLLTAAALLLGVGLFLCQASTAIAGGDKLRVIHTIVIDPGHGGGNEGARGVSGALEKDEVLRVAYVVRDRLKRDYPDVRVFLTRALDVDVPLTERIHLANELEADLFISLHMNSSVKCGVSGMEVFYLRPDMTMPMVTVGEGSWGKGFKMPPQQVGGPMYGPSAADLPIILADLERGRAHGDSALVAEVLLSELVRSSGRESRGVRQANFGVLRGAQVPAVVVEVGFLSHKGEEKWLRRPKTRRTIAMAMSRGVARIDTLFYRKSYFPSDGGAHEPIKLVEAPP